MNQTDLNAIKELLDQQTDRFEKRMIQVFNDGIENVILPHLSELSNKVDLIDDKISELDSRTGRIERKLDAVVDRQDRQGEEVQSIKKFIRMPEGA
ncbi:MAG: hypothetical protein HY779_03580 [Rubrobacteridae bacterium]|nr:hypothetical protein [Rubrobacteridae bacterium]